MKPAPLSVSVVIPTKNRPAEIARMLASLLAQPTMPAEVIVVDQSTPRYDLAPFPELVHLHDPALSGISAARNRGAAAARGEILFFVDDDVVFESDCIAELGSLFAGRPDVVGAQCAIHDVDDDAPLVLHRLLRRIFEHGFFDARPVRRNGELVPRLIPGLAAAYRRSLFAHETFDERLTAYSFAEDWDFTKRAARYGGLLVAEHARVRHETSATNRYDTMRLLKLRRVNTLYLFEKHGADRRLADRFWRRWWLVGEQLRVLRQGFRRRAPR